MNCLTRATHVINSTTSFQCVTKSLHVFTNLTSQVDLTKRTCFATKEPTQRGGSVPRNLGRNSSNYCIHPEKLRQIIKERDGHLLCSFFDSEDYKSKVTEFSQKQKQIISQGTPAGVNDEDIRYEHVLNCAQPLRCRKEFIVEKPDAKVSEVRFKYEKERVPKKITIMSAILKKKNAEDSKKMIHMPERKKSPILPTVKRTKLQVKDYPKRYKKTSTILPIYLRKMERNIERKHQQQENEESKPRTFYRDTAKKVFDTDSVDYKKQALNVRNYDANYGRRIRQDEMEMEEEEESEDRRIRDSRAKARAERERYVRDSPRKGALVYPDLKLVEYSIYDPRYSKAWPPRTEQTRPHQLEPTRRHVIDGSWPPRKKKNLKIEEHTEEPTRKFRAGGHSDNELFTKGIVIEEPKPDPATKKSLSEPSTQMEKDPDRVDHVTQMKTALKKQWSFLTKKLSRRKIKKMAKLSEGTKENLPAISEFELERPIDTSDLNKVRRRNMSTYGTRPRDDMVIDDVLTLYQKVKSGTCKEPFADKPCKYPFEHKEERNMDSSGGPSETYKVVADSKTRRSAELRNKYDLAETEHVRIEFVRKSEEDTERRIEVQKADKNVGRSTISFVDSGKRLADVTRDNVGSYADAVKENRESRRYAKKVSRLGTPSMPFNEYRKKSVDRENESFPGSKSDDYEENRKLGRRITRPPMPFVDFVKKDDGSLYNRTFARSR